MSNRALPLPILLFGALVPFAAACGEDDPVDSGTPASDVGFPDSGVRPDATTDAGPDASTDAGDTGVDAGDGGVPTDVGPKSIVFLHTNDEHSHYLGFAPEIDDFPALPDFSTDPGIKGGIYRRAAVLDSLKLEASQAPYNSPVALVSAGDIMMGSLFHLGNLFASPDYNIMDTVFQYNVMTLGNHEFDFGAARLATALSQGHLDPLTMSFSTLRTPLVVSNIHFSMTSPADDTLANYWSPTGATDKPIRRTHVQRFGNVNVGFVGVMGLDAALVAPFKSPVTFSLAVNTTACTSDADCAGSICVPPSDNAIATSGFCAVDPTGQSAQVNFPAMIADVAAAVASLRAQNVDLVVAVSHAGVNERELATLTAMGMGPENAMFSEEIVLAKGVNAALAAGGMKGLDLIIGGHSHTELDQPLTIPNADGSNTYIAQAGSYGRFVGKVRLTQAPGAPWVLDATYSGLEPVNGSVDATNLPVVTQLVLDGLLDQLISGLEGQGIATANDSLIFPGEQCDDGPTGLELPNNGDCLNVLPGATGGTLACHTNRQLDFSGCTLAVVAGATCGDGMVNGAEACDGTMVPLTCADLDYDGGSISCAANCTVNTSLCTPHFQSLLEIILNFQRPNADPPILHTPTTPQGELFFYTLGTTTFDVGETISTNESNLSNLVADANRAIANKISQSVAASGNPIQVSVVANGVIRDGIYEGLTGKLSLADLFRVMPLGVSPIENTPGYPLTDFYLVPAELKLAFEIGLSAGLQSDSFWLGFSGARVEYDLTRPALDRVVSIQLIDSNSKAISDPYADLTANYEGTKLYDAGTFRDPAELIHVSSDLYITLFATGFGICPRNATGAPFPQCAPCTQPTDCTAPGSTCDMTAHVCKGGNPVAFSVRSFVPTAALGIFQELKEFLALTSYVRNLPSNGALPTNYSEPTPRRLCCVGAGCPADGSRDCPALPN